MCSVRRVTTLKGMNKILLIQIQKTVQIEFSAANCDQAGLTEIRRRLHEAAGLGTHVLRAESGVESRRVRITTWGAGAVFLQCRLVFPLDCLADSIQDPALGCAQILLGGWGVRRNE